MSLAHRGKSTKWTRRAGRIWVALWLNYTLPWFWDNMFAVGMMERNSMPVSIAGLCDDFTVGEFGVQRLATVKHGRWGE